MFFYKKYKLTNKTITYNGVTLYRIKALKFFSDVKKGDLGGFVQSKKNLSQKGKCWIYDNAKVLDEACVYDDAKLRNNAVALDSSEIFDNAELLDNAKAYGKSKVYGFSKIYNNGRILEKGSLFDNACIHDDGVVCNKAEISGHADVHDSKSYVVFKNIYANRTYVTWTCYDNMWRAGDFYGTIEELITLTEKYSKDAARKYREISEKINNN
jgi:hypothetical protein